MALQGTRTWLRGFSHTRSGSLNLVEMLNGGRDVLPWAQEHFLMGLNARIGLLIFHHLHVATAAGSDSIAGAGAGYAGWQLRGFRLW